MIACKSCGGTLIIESSVCSTYWITLKGEILDQSSSNDEYNEIKCNCCGRKYTGKYFVDYETMEVKEIN